MSQQKLRYDRWILVPAVLLMIVGLLMVASASMVISDQSYGQPFHFLLTHPNSLTHWINA